MAEQIKIFELNIDVDAAIKSTAELKERSDALKRTLDSLKKSGDTSSESYVRLEAAQKNVNREYNAAQTQIGKLLKLQGQQITTVEQGRNALTILNKEWAKTASLYGENSKEADALAKKHLELKNRVNELQKGVGDTSGNIGNYTDSIVEAAGKTSLFGQAQGVVKNIMGIASPVYKAVKLEVAGLSASYKAATASTEGFTVAEKASVITTNLFSGALRVLKIALISTGIGAIIVVIGSLVAWFSKTQKGIDFVNIALAALGAAFDVVIDRAAKFGGAIVKLISLDFAGFWNDTKEAMEGVGDEMLREISLAIKLEQVLQDVAKSQVNLDIRRSAANARLKELNKTIEDVTKSEEERIKAAQEYARIETSLTNEEVSNQEKKVAAMLGFAEVTDDVRDKIKKIGEEGVSLDQLGLSESTLEDAKEFEGEISKLFNLQAARDEKLTTNQNKLNTIITQVKNQRLAAAKEEQEAAKAAAKAAQDRAKKATDDAIKENQIRLKIFEEENKGQAKSLAEGVKLQEQFRDKRLANLQQELEAGRKTKSEAELEELKIKNEFLEKQRDLTIEFAQQEVDALKASYKSKLENGQLLTDALVEQETLRLQTIADKEKEFQAKRLEEGVISQQEYNAAIDAVNEETRASREELDTKYAEQLAEKKAIDLENQRILDEEKLAYDAELQIQYLDAQRQKEIEAAEKSGADITKIKEKYAQQEEQIRAEVESNKIQLASQTFGNLVTILGKESAAGKAVAIAQTTIDTYQAAVAAYKAMAGIPVVGPALGAVAAGAAVAAGLGNVKKIVSTKNPDVPKAAKGITLKGNSHAQGGLDLFDASGNHLVNAEGDENIYVLNKRASALINGLSAVNEMTGGVPLSTPTSFAMDGGMVQRSLQTSQVGNVFKLNSDPIDYDLMAIKIADANRQLPPPVTDVTDIITQVNNVNRVVNGANI